MDNRPEVPRPPPQAPTRPAKRARQRLACEPCRRKKSKCDYTRPACSFCSRLGQTCYYAEEGIQHVVTTGSISPQLQDGHNVERLRQTEERLQMLESRLADVIGAVGQQGGQESHHPNSSLGTSQRVEQIPPQLPAFVTTALPTWEIVRSVASLYLECCDCQPLPLFHGATFINSLPGRDPEVLFSILALALRFSTDEAILRDCDELCRNYAEAARRLVMARISDGPIELSTLQSLCLLSLVDFTNGNKNRASIHSSLAMNLAHCAGLTTESPSNLSELVREERRRCFWSIFLLKRLHGADVNVLDFSGEENFPWYPKTTGTSSGSMEYISAPNESLRNGELKDLGVVAYAVQQSEVWFKTTRYARRRATPSAHPPWSPQSEYSIIVAQTMDFETRMPSKHRYKPSGFAQKTPAELQSNRAYWSPWLFCQFVYHTNLCLLNHPLILALRLRTFKHSMPEMFLQHTSDLISTHASWLIHLIDTLASKSYKVTDPFLAYCAAIVATIFLQESHNTDDESIRRAKQIDFGKCVDFIRSFAREWPHIARLAEKLGRLQETVSASYRVVVGTAAQSRGLLVDLGRFWEVLEYSSASEVWDSTRELFGKSLVERRRTDVGSEGVVTDMETLPTPTRLESTAAHVAATNEISQDLGTSSSTTYSPLANTQAFPDVVATMPTTVPPYNYGWINESMYSSDELAVLADSFFNQREGFGGMDVWRGGNL